MAETTAAVDLFVCGRLCLLGEHSDWAGGYRQHAGTQAEESVAQGRTIIVGTQEGFYATARTHDRQALIINTTSHDGKRHGPHEMPLDATSLLAEARAGGFWSYVAGTLYRLMTAHHIGGLVLDNHTTTLPAGKGLSSSAAICVLVARAFNRLYDLRLTIRGEMEFAYVGETTTPSQCGRMDQACAFGSIPVAMTFDGDLLHTQTIALKAPLYLVLVDLGAAKCTTTILACLQAAYPRPANDEQAHLHHLLGAYNLDVTRRALEAMTQGDVPALGRLMTEAQARFDMAAGPLCPSELTAPVLHRVLTLPTVQHLIWGAKGVGSGGDGTAQMLCRGEAEQAEVVRILSQDPTLSCMTLTVLPGAQPCDNGNSAAPKC